MLSRSRLPRRRSQGRRHQADPRLLADAEPVRVGGEDRPPGLLGAAHPGRPQGAHGPPPLRRADRRGAAHRQAPRQEPAGAGEGRRRRHQAKFEGPEGARRAAVVRQEGSDRRLFAHPGAAPRRQDQAGGGPARRRSARSRRHRRSRCLVDRAPADLARPDRRRRLKLAYDIAANHSAESASLRAEAEFHAGWYALEFLHEPAVAAKHFAAIAAISTRPLSLSRAEYWLGRAAAAAGDTDGATTHFQRAAAYPTAFYGQLASARLGQTQLGLSKPPPATTATRQRFQSRELVQVIQSPHRRRRHRPGRAVLSQSRRHAVRSGRNRLARRHGGDRTASTRSPFRSASSPAAAACRSTPSPSPSRRSPPRPRRRRSTGPSSSPSPARRAISIPRR